MRRLASGIDWVNRFVGRTVMHMYLVVALLSVYEVILRYVFHVPTTWSYEIVLALCAAAWALSGGHVALQRRHIAITVFYDISPPRVQRFLDVFALAFAAVALAFLVYLAIDLAAKSLHFVDRSGSAFNSPLPTLAKCLLVLGALLYLAQIVRELFRRILGNGGAVSEGGE